MFSRRQLLSGFIAAAGIGLDSSPLRADPIGRPAAEPGNGNVIARIRDAAEAAGFQYGIAVQAIDRISKPGPDGCGTLADFIRDQAMIYVPGIAFLPEHIQPQKDFFTLEQARLFIARAHRDAKDFRIHCLLYPSHEPAWVTADVNESNWQSRMDAHFEAIASVPGVGSALNIDVTNELISARYDSNDGYRPNTWYRAAGGPAYIPYAFGKARALFPDCPLFWCHDHTEQITDDFHRSQTRFVLNALERALKAGAPIDGYNMQGHLQLRLGFDRLRLRSFLNDLKSNLGLRIIIGELDCRTGYLTDRQTDTLPPKEYKRRQYDQDSAHLVEAFLDTALPFVKSSGGRQVLTWGISDIDNSWEENPKTGTPAGERPLPFDTDYRPKLMNAAIIRSFERMI